MSCHVLLQGIFPTKGLNLGLQHCRWIVYHLSHQVSLILDIINPNLRTTTTNPYLGQVSATPHQNPTATKIIVELKPKTVWAHISQAFWWTFVLGKGNEIHKKRPEWELAVLLPHRRVNRDAKMSSSAGLHFAFLTGLSSSRGNHVGRASCAESNANRLQEE